MRRGGTDSTVATIWSRQAVDAAMERRAVERDGVSAGLLELDDHSGRRLLDGAKLTGTTASEWARASAELQALWTVFEAYQKVLDRVAALRGGPKARLGDREVDALAELLTGRSVALPRQAVPFERRGLLDPASTQDFLTLDEAVASMTATYAKVKKVAVAAENAWNLLLDPLDQLSAKVRRARAAADEVDVTGDPVLGRLDRVERETGELRRQALTDPLGMVAAGAASSPAVDRLAVEAEGIRVELEQALVARNEFDQRVAALRDTAESIAEAEAQAERARAEVLDKIVSPRVPRPSQAAALLRTKVDTLVRERGGRSWTLMGRELATLEQNSRVILENARRRVSEVRAPLDKRDELRGLLDAYRARAARHGVAEHPEPSAAHRAAHELLWSAPCDLAAAEQAVRRYQAAVGAVMPKIS
jgi:hypothetical protein